MLRMRGRDSGRRSRLSDLRRSAKEAGNRKSSGKTETAEVLSVLQDNREYMSSIRKLTAAVFTVLLLLCCAAVPAAAEEIPAVKLSYEELDDSVFVKVTAVPENFNPDVEVKWASNAAFAQAAENTYTALLRGEDLYTIWALGVDCAGNAAAAVYCFQMKESTISGDGWSQYCVSIRSAYCKEIPIKSAADNSSGVMQGIGIVNALNACNTPGEKISCLKSVLAEAGNL